MKVIFLISDDYVWAPKVLERVLRKHGDQIAAVAGVPGTANHRNLIIFSVIYLNLLYPALFLIRAFQALMNHHLAKHHGRLTSIENVSNAFHVPYRKLRDINSPESAEWVRSFSPELLISIQPQWIKKPLLDLAPLGIMNIHPAKLPAYRGPAPIFWTLYRCEKETAVSAHFINEKFDDGALIAQEMVPVMPCETYLSLGEKITAVMPELISKAIAVVEKGGPYLPNIAFKGCYQSYPNPAQAFLFHIRQLGQRIKPFLKHEL